MSLCPTKGERYADLGARVDVYRRGADGEPEFVRTLPWIFGGKYDRLAGRYVAAPDVVHVLKVHEGQVPFLDLMWDDSVRYVMGLGAPGGGKTMNIVTPAGLYGIATPHRLIGMPAATWDGAEVVWRKFLALYEPKGWIADTRAGAMEIVFTNGTLYQFVGMTKKSGSNNSAAQGRDWHIAFPDEFQGIDDEAEMEIDARGRINKHYKIMSSATNSSEPWFQTRITTYADNPLGRIVRFTGPDNCFTPLEQWERMKSKWSPEDYDRIIKCLDVPQDGRVYPSFSRGDERGVMSVRPVPLLGKDITEDMTFEVYGERYKNIISVDPGKAVLSAHQLRAFRLDRKDRAWWVVREFVVKDKGDNTGHLAKELAQAGYDPEETILILDPHTETAETDQSDITILRNAGWTVQKASSSKIRTKHRYAMMNALFCDADLVRRLFVDCDENRRPKCPKFVESAAGLMYKGAEADSHNKNPKLDLTHYTDDVGYGLFVFESFRGTESGMHTLTASGKRVKV